MKFAEIITKNFSKNCILIKSFFPYLRSILIFRNYENRPYARPTVFGQKN